MLRQCVVVADGARARFFTLNEAGAPYEQGGPELFEHEDLSNPEHELPARELFANLRGCHHSHRGGSVHAYDDHRSRHEVVAERRFARRIARQALDLAHREKVGRCVIAANPKMLGFLRQELEGIVNGIRISEVAKDLAKLSVSEIHAHLAHDGLVPERKTRRTRRTRHPVGG